jgi:hypothetical protein
MEHKTHCLLVTDDAFVSLDLAEGLAEVFKNVEVTLIASCQEALRQLPDLPAFALALLDERSVHNGWADLPPALMARGTRVALLGSDPELVAQDPVAVLDWPFGYEALRDFLIRLRACILAAPA